MACLREADMAWLFVFLRENFVWMKRCGVWINVQVGRIEIFTKGLKIGEKNESDRANIRI